MSELAEDTRQLPVHKSEKVELVNIEELTTHPRNQEIYGDEPDADLINDIQAKGIREPLICEELTGCVISGRRRHKAAKTLGMKKVPVIWRSYDNEADATEAIIMHNAYRRKSERQVMMEVEALWERETEKNRQKMSEGGRKGKRGPAGTAEEQESDPQEESPQDDLDERVVGGTKIAKKPKPRTTREQVGKAIGQAPMKVARAAAIIKNAKDRLGDKWKEDPTVQAVFKGESSINSAALAMQKDKRDKALLEKAKEIKEVDADIRHRSDIDDIENESVDHVIADPDFWEKTGYVEHLRERDGDESFTDVFEGWNSELLLDELSAWCSEWARVIRTGGNVAVFCPEPYVSFLREALISNGFDQVSTVVWHVTNPDSTSKHSNFISACEYIITACMAPEGDKRLAFRWLGNKKMQNFVEGDCVKGRGALRDMGERPEFLLKWLVERLTNPGDLVLDNFAGTGTTGIACKKLKRNFVLVEKDEKVIEIMKSRLAGRS